MTKRFFILNFLRLYNILWKLLLPFLAKNSRLKPGFKKRTDTSHLCPADIWIQAASAGEAYIAVHLVKTLAPEKPLKILATTITQQGMDILKSELSPANIHPLITLKIEWAPFDQPSIIEQAVSIIHPQVMVLLETEIWPALLWHLKQNRSRIYIINARLSKKSYAGYRRTVSLWKHLSPDAVLATSDLYAERYKKIFNAARVTTMSNIKFESMEKDLCFNPSCGQMEKILPASIPLTILASIRKQEEKQTISIIKALFREYPNQIVAVFPRHMHRIKVWEKRLKHHQLNYCLKSSIDTMIKEPKLILWDTFGELKTAYEYASVVFVGASLAPLGGQNFIEPAVAGAVTVTGPYYDDFDWAEDCISNAGIVIENKTWLQVKNTIVTTLSRKNQIDRSTRKQKAYNYILSHSGGTQQACNEILKAFDE